MESVGWAAASLFLAAHSILRPQVLACASVRNVSDFKPISWHSAKHVVLAAHGITPWRISPTVLDPWTPANDHPDLSHCKHLPEILFTFNLKFEILDL